MVKYGNWEYVLNHFMRRPIIFVTSLLILCILLFDLSFGYTEDLMEQHAGNTVSITGKIEKATMKDEEYYQIVLSDILLENGTAYGRRVLVYVYSHVDDYLYLDGSYVTVSGEVEIPAEKKNPNCFDYRKHLKSIGIRTVLKADRIIAVKPAGKLRRSLCRVRGDVITLLNKEVGGDRAGIIIGMLFGDKSYISEDSMEMFQKGGTAHILAVSGLHIGILYGFLIRFRKKKRSLPHDAAVAAFLLMYSALCWFTASVMRAVLMIFIHMAAEHLNRRYDFTCSICTAMIILLVIQPYQIYNTGFQMSFLAAFTLAVILPAVGKKIKGMMLPIVSIQIGMLPYIAYTFNYVSLAALIGNIPIAFLSSLIIPAGVLLLFLSAIGAGAPVAQMLGFLADVLMKCNELTYAGGILTFDCISPPLFLVIFTYAALFFFLSESGKIARIRNNRKVMGSAILLAMLFSAVAYLISADHYGGCEYTFVDVGQGDCLHVSEAGMDILIDGGGSASYNVGEKTLKPYLLKNGTGHVDLAIATHLHTDHFQGICELSRCYPIKTLAVYAGEQEKEDEIRSRCRAEHIIYLEKGDIISLGKHGTISILAPEEGSRGDDADENARSLVVKIEIDGVSVMMTGDIDENGERKVISGNSQKDLSCRILKIAHHGSHYSSSQEFLQTVRPGIAIISVGKNTYGHPSPETLERLEGNNIPYYRTDEQGAIGIDVDGKKVKTMK